MLVPYLQASKYEVSGYMEYNLDGKRLIWNYNKELGCKALKDNNLYIENIWNMKDTVGYTDSCIMLKVLSKDTFYFTTFNGLGFTMFYNGSDVICIGKRITK